MERSTDIRTAAAAPLRVAAAVGSQRVPAWFARTLEQLAEAGFAEHVATAVVPEADAGERPASGLLRAYERLDRRLLSDGPDPLAPVELGAGAPTVAPGDLGELDLDVVLTVGPPSTALTPSLARHGIWWVEPGDGIDYRGNPAGFWELAERNGVTGSVLAVRSGDDDRPRVAYRSYSATHPLSLQRTRRRVLWKSAEFAPRRLRDLHAGRWSPADAEPFAVAPRGAPSGARVLTHGAHLAGGLAARRLRRARERDRWAVAYRSRPRGARSPEGGGFGLLDAPAGHWYADPCLLEHGGSHHLFMEDYDERSGRAGISCVELGTNGDAGTAMPVLVAGHHLSYPYVFEADGEAYMVPESAAERAVDLYRAAAYPGGWERVARLLDGVAAYDATLLARDGIWWMFASVAPEGASGWDELHVYWSGELAAGWRPHPLNPVVSDVRRARPAGRPFERDGVLIRPAQDCSRGYGSAIVLNRVDELTPETYSETALERIEPDWMPGIAATHTWTFDAAFEALDARTGRRR